MIVRDLRDGVRTEPAAHPLLDQRVYDGSDDVVFSTLLRPGSHWILTDHMLGDMPVVPGAAVVEMIQAAYAEAVGGPVEVADIVFAGPIAITGPTELRTVLRPAGDGFDATVVKTGAGAEHEAGAEHVRATVRPGPSGTPPVHDLAVLRKRCDRETLDFTNRPDGLVSYGEHWRNVGTVHSGDGEDLARVELDERFHPECAEYVLHPGLLDDAVSNSHYLPASVAGAASYLPMSYGRIVVHAALPPAFWVHVHHRDAGGGDELVFDLVLLDDDGRELVRVEGYALRQVDPTAALAGGVPSPDRAPTDAAGEAPDGTLSESTAMDALRRILHHLPKPHLIVSPEGLANQLHRVERLTGDQLTREIGEASLPAQPTGERMVDTPYAAPENELQEMLVDVLQNALGVRQVGIDDDFFELGGNSLVAVQLGFRLRELFEVDVPIASLLEQPTARGLAAAMDRLLRAKATLMSADETAATLDQR